MRPEGPWERARSPSDAPTPLPTINSERMTHRVEETLYMDGCHFGNEGYAILIEERISFD